VPRIKHWFPVSHDLNHDPEVWELTNTFGDWMLLAWLDILSVTDRAEGQYMGSPTAIAATLSKLCLGLRRDKDEVRRRFKGTNAAYRSELALYWMTLRRWLLPIILTDQGEIVLEWWPNHARMVAEWSPNRYRIVGEWWPNGAPIIGFKTRNHWKYHRTQEPKQFPPNQTRPNQTKPIKNIVPHDTKKPWPPEDQWLSDLLKSQWFLSHCNGEVQDYGWWEDTAKSLAGLDRQFMEKELAKMSAWFKENPSRKKTAKGMRRFLRTWLEKAKNQGGQYVFKH